MKKQFRVIGTDIKTGKPFDSGWCNEDTEKIMDKGKEINFTVTLDYMDKFAFVCNQILTDWQMEFREVEA